MKLQKISKSSYLVATSCFLTLAITACGTPQFQEGTQLVNCFLPERQVEVLSTGTYETFPGSIILTTRSRCRSSGGNVLTAAQAKIRRAEMQEEAERNAREYALKSPPSDDSGQTAKGSNLHGATARPKLELLSTGTGFVVSKAGHVLTNYHVVDECVDVRIGKHNLFSGEQLAAEDTALSGPFAAVLASDEVNDLALLVVEGSFSQHAILRSEEPIRPGDDIVVVGYPLRGLLASEANVTKGSVSARAGLGNDTRLLQITAPVQSGNSGGPVLDMKGRIVGVVVSKFNALRLAAVTGEIPQNINFAIKVSVVKSFLEAHSVPTDSSRHLTPADAAQIGADAASYTVPLECWG